MFELSKNRWREMPSQPQTKIEKAVSWFKGRVPLVLGVPKDDEMHDCCVGPLGTYLPPSDKPSTIGENVELLMKIQRDGLESLRDN